MGRPLYKWVRLAVSVGVFGLLLTFVPASELLAALGRVPGHTVAAALLLFVLGHVTAAWKWRLLQGREAGLSTHATLRAHFSGVLANLWLPSVVGGDLVRAGLVFKQSSRPALVVAASLVDRAVDSIGLLLLAGAGLLLAGGPLGGALREWLGIVAALCALGLILAAVLYRYLRRAAGGRMLQVVSAFEFLMERPGRVMAALAISVAVQVTFIAVNALLGRAVGMHASFAAWLMAWPLAKLAALAPISMAGFGVREAALVMLMQPFGDPADAILAAGLLWQAVFLSGGALGWLLLSLVPEGTPGWAQPHSARK